MNQLEIFLFHTVSLSLFIYFQIVKQQDMQYKHSADIQVEGPTKVAKEALTVGQMILFVQSIVENKN